MSRLSSKHKLKYKVGDRLQLYRPEGGGGVTAVVVKVAPSTNDPYKVRFDTVDPFDGTQHEKWVSRAVVFGKVD